MVSNKIKKPYAHEYGSVDDWINYVEDIIYPYISNVEEVIKSKNLEIENLKCCGNCVNKCNDLDYGYCIDWAILQQQEKS